MIKPELDDKVKEHIQNSFGSLMDAHAQGKEVFAAALKQHLKNLDPGELLDDYLPPEGQDQGGEE